MINSSGSRRGWRGGRRIVLVAARRGGRSRRVRFGGNSVREHGGLTGAVEPLNKKKPGVDAKLDFSCSEEIRGFGVTHQQDVRFLRHRARGARAGWRSAGSRARRIQCEGNVPGPGFGCGSTNRASAQPPGTGACEAIAATGTAPDRTNTFGPPCNNRVDPGDTAELQVGFPQNPCKPTGQYAPGKDKLRIWLSVLTEPTIGSFSADFGPQDNTVVHPRHLHLGAVQAQERVQVRWRGRLERRQVQGQEGGGRRRRPIRWAPHLVAAASHSFSATAAGRSPAAVL